VEQHGVRLLGGHPHHAAGAMLLEMAFTLTELPPVFAFSSFVTCLLKSA
jgi:hypothetical protein